MKFYFLSLTAIIFFTLFAYGAGEPSIMDGNEAINMKTYYVPFENEKHEGTWLNWPHHYTYGEKYRNEIENIWLEMAYALHRGENVHIIAYNETEKKRIINLLLKNKFNMNKIDFVIAKSDDVWSRDTGPIFAYDEEQKLVIVDFAFDGWGKKAPYKNDDKIPEAISKAKNIDIVKVQDFVLEGGSVELDGKGTAMLSKSSVVSENRNAKMKINEAEKYLSRYLGVSNFIWINGVIGEDITDAHIDGIARFYDDKTILTVSKKDFLDMYEEISESDYDILKSAHNANGKRYNIIELPMTSKNVKGLKYKGNYLNYYVGNDTVLIPVYNDVNDKKAIEIFEKLFKGKQIVPIDVTALYKYGGMIHCITQQEPLKK